jgi:hypothetical protein
MLLSRARFSTPQARGESASQRARQVFKFLKQNPHAAGRSPFNLSKRAAHFRRRRVIQPRALSV